MDTLLMLALISLIASGSCIVYSLYTFNRFKKISIQSKEDSSSIAYLRSVREKPRKRYIVFQLTPIPDENSKDYVKKMVEAGLRRIIGEIGLVRYGFAFIDYVPSTGRVILQVYHLYVDSFLGVIGVFNSRSEYSLVPLSTTGTIRRARRIANR